MLQDKFTTNRTRIRCAWTLQWKKLLAFRGKGKFSTGTKSLIVCKNLNIITYAYRLCWFALLESLSSRRSWGHGRQEGCARSGSSTAFVAQKAKIKQWMVFGISRVTDVLSVFTFSYLKCLHSWPSISNFRKIFVAKRNSYIFFVRQAWNAVLFYLIV